MLQQTLNNFSFFILILTVPLPRQLVTMPVYVGFVLDSVTMGQVSLPCQHHSTIFPYWYSIHLSMTLYVHTILQRHLRKCLPHSHPSHPPLFPSALQQHLCHILEMCFTPITLQQLFWCSWFQASAPKQPWIVLFCVTAQWVVVISYWHFRTPIGPILKAFAILNPENGNSSCPETSVRNHHYWLHNTKTQFSFCSLLLS